ncbi:hypothetical protein QN277_013540 [Acacia crassicarpa]|uniref:J domain-containing protein n=1 Tax=Acacia crassicarpa TaxID=499986 RepID=A0AAE1N2L9_9FABA|nr:hypothetical protein QN277_013540 [Acacia crassicarpa]
MQAHLLVGPIPIAGCGGGLNPIADSNLFIAAPPGWSNRRHRRLHHGHWRSPLIVASSSADAINGEQNHYVMLGLDLTASAADIKRAYRLLARKYHPDVSKDSQAAELFKSIRRAYEVLSNEVTRNQYDRSLKFGRQPNREKCSYGTEFDDEIRMYKWTKLRQKMYNEAYWERYNVNEGYYKSSETEEEEEEGEEKLRERSSFIEVLRSAFMSLLLFQTFGARLSLTFSSLTALFDRKLDTGYKMGYVMAWILGGRGGILLTLCLSFASWVCGKTSSSVVSLVVVAMWVGSHLARYAPLPQGALLTLIYMSIKLQSDL